MERLNSAWPGTSDAIQDLDAHKIERLKAVALASKRLREMLAAEFEASRKKENHQEK